MIPPQADGQLRHRVPGGQVHAAPESFARPLRAHLLRTAFILASAAACAGSETPTTRQAEVSRPGAPASDSLPANARRVRLAVSGMACESCESSVTAMLRRTPGVLRTEVSVERNEAVIFYDPARTTPAALAKVVATLGYAATPRDSSG